MKPFFQVYLIVALGVLAGGIAGYSTGYSIGYDQGMRRSTPYEYAPTNFEECAKAGYPVMESYPRQCHTKDGRTFVEQVAIPPVPPPTPPSDGTPPDRMAGCVPAGCSGVICADSREAANIVTTCEYRAEYACYKSATCERQPNGECGWTPTPSLQACLKNPPALE